MTENDSLVFQELVAKIKPELEKLHTIMNADGFSYKIVKWDIAAITEKRSKALQELQLLEQDINSKKSEAVGIVAGAKEEAKAIRERAAAKMAEAMQKMAEAEKNLEESKKAKYLAKV